MKIRKFKADTDSTFEAFPRKLWSPSYRELCCNAAWYSHRHTRPDTSICGASCCRGNSVGCPDCLQSLLLTARTISRSLPDAYVLAIHCNFPPLHDLWVTSVSTVDTVTGFSPSTSVSPASITAAMLHPHSAFCQTLYSLSNQKRRQITHKTHLQ